MDDLFDGCSAQENEDRFVSAFVANGGTREKAIELLSAGKKFVDERINSLIAEGVHPSKAIHQVTSEFLQAAKMESPRVAGREFKKELSQIGALLWPITYKHTEDEREACERFLEESRKQTNQRISMLGNLAHNPSDQLSFMLSALWYHQGLPQVVMGHKFAASLLSTNARIAGDWKLAPPWRAFWIEVPRGLLSITDGQGKAVSVDGILVGYDTERGWSYLAYGGVSCIWTINYPTSEMYDPEEIDQASQGTTPYASLFRAFKEDLSDIDKRCGALIRRLIVNVCLSMSDPDNLKELTKSMGGKSKRDSNVPLIRTYQLGNTPSVDCREAVSRFLHLGSGGIPSVQVLVAGHWKRQPCGHNSMDRKLIHVEPYWRGPEEAPVKPRAAILGR